MANKILEIKEVYDLQLKPIGYKKFSIEKNKSLGADGYDGFKVKTEQGDLYILIDNGQCCCESWGYFSTDDELQNFIGADLLDIELTYTALTTKSITELENVDEDANIQFVTFKTDKGVFQLAVYNSHNGFYGHTIYVVKYDKCILDSCL